MTGPAASTADTCSAASLALGEPVWASAPEAGAWLLVEHPGAWRRDAFTAGMEPGVAAELARRADEAGARLLAVRQPGEQAAGHGRRVTLAGPGPEGPWTASTTVGHEGELLDLDLAAVAGGRRPAGMEPDTAAIYAVCTHAGRDACCGRLGRPMAAALAAARPGRVWECSHLGGHRFAGNLLCLPVGVLYGRLGDGAEAVALAESLERGILDLARLRGLTWQPRPAQAADALVRHRTGLRGLGQLVAGPVVELGASTWAVALRAGSAAGQATVRWTPTGRPRPFSCGSDELEDPGGWELLELDGHLAP